jgi:hypothetical protein
MNDVLWVIAGVLAASFVTSALLKLTRTKEQLQESGLGWVEDFSPQTIKLIGVAEGLGAIGLVLPAVVDVAEVLVPVAATALAVVMAGAFATHLRRREAPLAVVNLVFLGLLVFVAVGRFGAHSF